MIEEIRYTNKADAIEAVSQDGNALKYVSEELQGDRDIVMAALKNDGCALAYASKNLRIIQKL